MDQKSAVLCCAVSWYMFVLTLCYDFSVALSLSQVISVNYSVKEERALLQGFQKLVALSIALLQSVLFVLAGFYGSVGVVKSFLLIVQLFASSCVVIYFDELLQKGYGIGSGISLFTWSAVSLEFMWKVRVADDMQ